jgi:hypothetical protein
VRAALCVALVCAALYTGCGKGREASLEDPPLITSATCQHTLYNGKPQPIEAKAEREGAPLAIKGELLPKTQESMVKMIVTRIEPENITVFDSLSINLPKGMNVFIGENGTGKTHLLKLLYSACQAALVRKTAIGFDVKIARTFKPDELSLRRIVGREGRGNKTASIKVYSGEQCLSLVFDAKNVKFAEIEGNEAWSKQFSGVTSAFIPAKEILSHAKSLI